MWGRKRSMAAASFDEPDAVIGVDPQLLGEDCIVCAREITRDGDAAAVCEASKKTQGVHGCHADCARQWCRQCAANSCPVCRGKFWKPDWAPSADDVEARRRSVLQQQAEFPIDTNYDDDDTTTDVDEEDDEEVVDPVQEMVAKRRAAHGGRSEYTAIRRHRAFDVEANRANAGTRNQHADVRSLENPMLVLWLRVFEERAHVPKTHSTAQLRDFDRTWNEVVEPGLESEWYKTDHVEATVLWNTIYASLLPAMEAVCADVAQYIIAMDMENGASRLPPTAWTRSPSNGSTTVYSVESREPYRDIETGIDKFDLLYDYQQLERCTTSVASILLTGHVGLWRDPVGNLQRYLSL